MSKARELAELGAVYDSGALSNRNLIINGGMTVAQRGSSQTGVGIDTYTNLDRFKQYAAAGGMAGRSTSTQETITDLNGFTKALKLQVTTADTSVGSTDSYGLTTRLEADDILRLGIGTANAQAVTLSFYAKAPTGGGVFCAGISLPGGGNYFEEVTIGTSWARHEIKIPATTTSSHATTATGTATGIEVQITLMAGSSYNTLTNKTWSAGGSNRATSNQTNFYSSTSNNLFVTGMQLEAGTEATPFEHRSFSDELRRCQRHLHVYAFTGSSGNAGYETYRYYSTTNGYSSTYNFPVTMRAAPAATIGSTPLIHAPVNTANAGGTIAFQQANAQAIVVTVTPATDFGANQYTVILNTGNVAYSAEL